MRAVHCLGVVVVGAFDSYSVSGLHSPPDKEQTLFVVADPAVFWYSSLLHTLHARHDVDRCELES